MHRYGNIPISKNTGKLDLEETVTRLAQHPDVVFWAKKHPREAWTLQQMGLDTEREQQRSSFYNAITAGTLTGELLSYLWKLAGFYEKHPPGKRG